MRLDGFDFGFDASACVNCNGNCCASFESGYVWVSIDEIERIADFLKIELTQMAKSYLKRINKRFSLIEKRLLDGRIACVFFDEFQKRCQIYEVRPEQCKSYPFWKHLDPQEVKKECLGIYF